MNKDKIKELVANDKTEQALEMLKDEYDDAILYLAKYNQAKKCFLMEYIDKDTWSKIKAQINWSIFKMIGLSTNIPNIETKKLNPLLDVEIGDEVWVCPRGSGPYSGEGFETVTKISTQVEPETNQSIKIFKTDRQWFSAVDGSPITAPWGYHVSHIKK